MKRRIETVLDGVPVIFELLSVGPASPEAITNFEQNIEKETSPASLANPLSIETASGKLQVVKVGNGKPATQEQIEKVQNAINTGAINPQELIDRINQIEQAISQSTNEKPWWTSKIILSNAAFIVSAIAARFGFNIEIGEDWLLIIGSILGAWNIYLRKGTSRPIAKNFLPK